MATSDEESQQLQEGAVKNQETNKQECAAQESITTSRTTQLSMWLHRFASLPIQLSDLPLKVHDRELEASCREVASCLLWPGC